MMDRERHKIIGVVLCFVGGIFYLQICVLESYFSHRNDFAHLYVAGYLAGHGGNFFDPQLMLKSAGFLGIERLNPFVYPPFFALLLAPLSQFNYDAAWSIFFLLSHLAYFLSLALLVRLFSENQDQRLFWWGVSIALSACYFPLYRSFSAGQMNTFLLLAIVLAYFLAWRGKDILSGLVLGLGAAVKVAPAFLLIHFLVKGRWLVFVSGCMTILFTLCLSIGSLGLPIHLDFLEETLQMGYGSSTWSQFGQHFHVEPHNQAPSAVWYRLFTHNESTQGIIHAPGLAKILSIATALLLVGGLLLITKRMNRTCALWEYSLWIAGMLMIPSLFWDHYLVQALPAILFALYFAWQGKSRGIGLLSCGIGLIAIPYLYDYPFLKQGTWTLLMGLKLFGLLLVILYLLWHRKDRDFKCDMGLTE